MDLFGRTPDIRVCCSHDISCEKKLARAASENISFSQTRVEILYYPTSDIYVGVDGKVPDKRR